MAEAFADRPLHAWLDLFESEDVCAGPVATLEEAAREFGESADATAPKLGEHTAAWRRKLGA